MNNNFDLGLQEDFDRMTDELAYGRYVIVHPRLTVLTSDSEDGIGTGLDTGTQETVAVQEIDTGNEAFKAGIMDIGDVHLTFRSDSIAEEEGYVVVDSVTYKILGLTKVNGQTNNSILYIKAQGKKVPFR